MKKLVNSLVILLMISVFTACGVSVQIGDEDKDNQVVTPDETTNVETPVDEEVDTPTNSEDTNTENTEDENTDTDEEGDEDNDYAGQNYITLTSPLNEADFREEPIEFTGVVSPNTTKIVITAEGGTKPEEADGIAFPYYQDVYTLENYKAGDTEFTYRAKMDYNNLTLGANDYEVKAFHEDGTTSTAYVTIYFYGGGGAEIGKPVIYLYPETTTKVFVDVDPDGGFSITEPEIGDGWNVVATPDSKILNLADKKVYPYLFWEGYAMNFETPKQGFVIAKSEVENFFDEKLSILGMIENEINDFKEFWLPKFEDSPYYFITFIPQEQFDTYAPLTITPQPDNIIRVIFDYQGLDEKIDVTEQNLETPVREGFTVLEWGGRLYR